MDVEYARYAAKQYSQMLDWLDLMTEIKNVMKNNEKSAETKGLS